MDDCHCINCCGILVLDEQEISLSLSEWLPSQHLVMYVSKDMPSLPLGVTFVDSFELPVSGFQCSLPSKAYSYFSYCALSTNHVLHRLQREQRRLPWRSLQQPHMRAPAAVRVP